MAVVNVSSDKSSTQENKSTRINDFKFNIIVYVFSNSKI